MQLAHVFIGRYELQVPLYTVITAAVAVVAASFGLIYLRPPRLRGAEGTEGLRVPAIVVRLLQSAALAYVGLLIVVGLFGRQDLIVNAAGILFWVITIPVLPLLHCLLGGAYGVANPFALIARVLTGGRSARQSQSALLARVGYWPAVGFMFLLFWFELALRVVPGSPRTLGFLALAYTIVQVVMGVWLGEDWYRGGDMIQAITALPSLIAPVSLVRNAEGWVHLRVGFRPDRALWQAPGRQAFITLWLAGVLADGVLKTPIWSGFLQPALAGALGDLGKLGSVDVTDLVSDTSEIVFTWIAFAVFFWTFAYVAATLARFKPVDLALVVAPSLIPIALAYLLAHNLTQVIVYGPLAWTARDVSPEQARLQVTQVSSHLNPGVFWWLAVTAIVVGHIIAVLMAHARLAEARRDETLALRADLGWLSAMLLYTATSLWVIAQPATTGG